MVEPLIEKLRQRAGEIRGVNRLIGVDLTFDDVKWPTPKLMREAAAALEQLQERVAEVEKALRESDRVLGRIVAPCPQCHTLGNVPGCTTLVHLLPQEARDDIYAARNQNLVALSKEGS